MEYLSGPWVALAFLVLAAPIVWVGARSLNWLGPITKWVAIGVRCAVLLLALLILGGARWQREHKDLEVLVLRDISTSTSFVKNFPKPASNLQAALDAHFLALANDPEKPAGDRVGVMSFHDDTWIDALPSTNLTLGARGVRRTGSGTDVASALQLALASMSKDAMRRLLLVWDGNATAGDLDSVLSTAASQHVQVDVLPLRYKIGNEVFIERFVAPNWKREDEPFTMEVILQSTQVAPVKGKLTVLHAGEPLDLDLTTPARESTKAVTLKQGVNVVPIRVPGNLAGGMHQFRALLETEGGADSISTNNVADAFTIVRGEGKVLYVEAGATAAESGDVLQRALASEGIKLESMSIDQFPNNLVQLQDFDAVILANVPRGVGGLSDDKADALAAYVHETGGGLVMIGGPDAFGAGGWNGSKLEQVLPVDMDIPAQRQIPQGALVLVIDRSGSMSEPFGDVTKQDAVNQAAILALRALLTEDMVGVVAFDGAGQWIYPLQVNRYPNAVADKLKTIGMGGGTSIISGLTEAIPPLAQSNAAVKHILLLTDGLDQQSNYDALLAEMKKRRITLSTVGVGNGHDAALLTRLASAGRGNYYPVSTPSMLPQVFIKEARLVRRTLIHENDAGIPLVTLDTGDELTKGLSSPQPLFGMVLTSKKNDPKVMMPLGAQSTKDGTIDPVFAHWQSGLGRTAVFTGDAHNKWAARWVAGSNYAKFWAQVVRGVSRPPMSTDFDVQTTVTGDRGKVVFEAIDKDNRFLNFLNIAGSVTGPDLKQQSIRAVQTAPGRYEAEFKTSAAGNYVVGVSYADKEGKTGHLLSGAALNASPELRDLSSNEAKLREVAERTGGRLIWPEYDVKAAQLFRREGLHQTASSMPVWDWLMPFLLGLIIVDVAVRRIAWDWNSTKRMALGAVAFVRSHTTTRTVETRKTVDALAGIKQKSTSEQTAATTSPRPAPRPDPKAKFAAADAAKVEGDITKIVGGATNKPIPPAPTTGTPKGMPTSAGDHLGGLMAAKRRAQQQISEKGQSDEK